MSSSGLSSRSRKTGSLMLAGDTHAYLWKVPSTNGSMYKSAVHAVELAYVFNNLEDEMSAGEVDSATAVKVQESWVNSAKAGNPSVEDAAWKAYNTDTRDTMRMNRGSPSGNEW